MLKSDDFEALVLKNDKLVLVDFMASWCPPCKLMAPVIDQLKTEYGDKCFIEKLDIDAEREIAVNYSVNSIPTFIFFKEGKEVARKVGFTAKQVLKDVIETYA